MTTEDFITALFYRVDNRLKGVAKHSQAKLYPSEVVTIALLFALLSLAVSRLSGFVPELA